MVQHVDFDRFGLAQIHEYSSKAASAMQTVLCKRPPITYNLYRGRNRCTMHVAKATAVCVIGTRLHLPRGTTPRTRQLIDIFYSLLAASIYCHRGRHRCDTVIHACLQPTRGLCLKTYLNFGVRPSGGRLRLQHITKDCCCG